MTDFTTPIEPTYPLGKRSPDATLTELRATETRIKGALMEAIAILPNKDELITELDYLPSATELASALNNVLTRTEFDAGIKSILAAMTSTPPVTGLPPLAISAYKPLVIPASLTDADYVPSVQMIGANMAGGEIKAVPPRDDAKYPTGEASLKYMAERGFNHIRVPFRWHRLQKTPLGPLEAWHITELKKVVRIANLYGMTVNFEPHDYAERGAPPPVGSIKAADGTTNAQLGSPELPTAWLVDFWRKFAAEFKGNPFVHFGLMNEPKCSKEVWWPLAQEIVEALRTDGVRNFITVPGCHWTGAHSWVSSGNANFAERLIDPAKNMAFEVHQYLDSDHSGQQGGMCSLGSGRRLDAVTSWANTHDAKLYLGEVAAGDPAKFFACGTEFPILMKVVKDNPAVWSGFAAWHGGAISLTSEFRLEPKPTDPPNTITPLTKMIVDTMVVK